MAVTTRGVNVITNATQMVCVSDGDNNCSEALYAGCRDFESVRARDLTKRALAVHDHRRTHL